MIPAMDCAFWGRTRLRRIALTCAALALPCFGLVAAPTGKTAEPRADATAVSADRLPVPTAAAQAAALKSVKDVFRADFANNTPAGRKALARKLLQQAGENKEDPAARYVLLRESRDIAANLGDAETVLAAIDELSRSFAGDNGDATLTVLTTASKAATEADSRRLLFVACGLLANQAMDGGNYGVAARFAALAENVARGAQDSAMLDEARAFGAEVKRVQQEYTRVKPFEDKLKTAPADAEANFQVGRFYCLIKADWERGLPLLAKGSDAPLKGLAAGDLAMPEDAAARLGVADGWWELADKQRGPVQRTIQKRAGYWYEQALPELKGLVKARVEQRLTTIAPEMLSDLAWISKRATYVASSQYHIYAARPELLNGTGGGWENNSLAFHTNEDDPPFIVIDLGSTAQVTGLEIVNAKTEFQNRAKTMAVWVASDSAGPWRKVWTNNEGIKPSWKFALSVPATGRYVRIGLEEKNYFHLHSVKIYGKLAGSHP
jgi:hypothetical protein